MHTTCALHACTPDRHTQHIRCGAPPYFDEYLALQAIGAGEVLGLPAENVSEVQFVPQDLPQVLGDLLLLLDVAVVLYGQDHRVPGGEQNKHSQSLIHPSEKDSQGKPSELPSLKTTWLSLRGHFLYLHSITECVFVCAFACIRVCVYVGVQYVCV